MKELKLRNAFGNKTMQGNCIIQKVTKYCKNMRAEKWRIACGHFSDEFTIYYPLVACAKPFLPLKDDMSFFNKNMTRNKIFLERKYNLSF